MREALPIDPLLPDIVAALRAGRSLVVQAPTGAGKTTRVPRALHDAGLGHIVLLEPRRVAARAAARRMAEELGEEVGGTVGYQVRFDSRQSARTRVLVVTEGVLLSRLVADPFLEGIQVVIFDEIHERSLDADLTLALARQVQAEVRPDLKLLAMSATLETSLVAAALQAPILRSEGRTWPVDIHYLPRPDDRPIEQRAADHAASVFARTGGDVLVFLPGVGEIERTRLALQALLPGVPLIPLHGRLPPEEQDRALRPGDRRRVVLATNVAETSVTLPGVTAVVDTGLVRQQRHDARRGLDRLELEPISRASADQRAGRAGRVGPGTALRLWTELSHGRRPAHDLPEIHRVDLARPLLQLLAFGEDPRRFAWLQPPPEHAVEAGMALLTQLGAVQGQRITAIGRQLAELPTHPRIARLLLEGHARGLLREATMAAALLEERLPLSRAGPRESSDSDIDDLLASVAGQDQGWRPRFPGALTQLRTTANQLAERTTRALGPVRGRGVPNDLATCLLRAWPDRVATRRADGRLTLATGRGARLSPESAVQQARWLVALDVQDTDEVDAIVHLAAAIDPADLPTISEGIATFDPATDRVITAVERRYGTLVLDRRNGAAVDEALITAALLEGARRAPNPPWPHDEPDFARLLARLRFLPAGLRADLPPVDNEALHTLAADLAPGRRSLAELRAAPWAEALLQRLSWPQRQRLDELVPDRLLVPSGNHIRVDYESGPRPVLAVRMQELFGCSSTPRIAGQPVLLHLLAPSRQVQQITDDLAGFWARTWPDVRKDLRARYPRHSWPDDPTVAPPQTRPARRS